MEPRGRELRARRSTLDRSRRNVTKLPGSQVCNHRRKRFSSVSCTEESTEGEDENPSCLIPVQAKAGFGLSAKRRFNGNRVKTFEEDVIDGFLILSFKTYQDLEAEIRYSKPSSKDKKQEKAEEPSSQNSDRTLDGFDNRGLENGLYEEEKDDFEMDSQATFEEETPITRNEGEPFEGETVTGNKVPETEPEWTEIEANISESVQQAERVTHSYPVKPHQNGTVQPLEPSTAVAAVTVNPSNHVAVVPGSSPCPDKSANPLPSSTSPAGGVPFPLSLLHQEEYSAASTKPSTDESPPRQPTVNQKYCTSYGSGVGASQVYSVSGDPLRLPASTESYPTASQIAKHCQAHSTSHAYQSHWDSGNRTKNYCSTGHEGVNANSSYSAVSQSYAGKYTTDTVTKHRSNYPKDRTYDYLRRTESQRKSTHSKTDSSSQRSSQKEAESQHHQHHHHHHHHHHTQNHITSGNLAYQQTKHKHSDHKTYTTSLKSHEKNDFQKQQQQLYGNLEKQPLKDSPSLSKKQENCESFSSKYCIPSTDRLSSSTTDPFVGFSKQNLRHSVNNSVHEKWTESSFQHTIKKDSYQTAGYPYVAPDKKLKDLSSSQKDNSFTYKKCYEDGKLYPGITQTNNKTDEQRSAKVHSNELSQKEKQFSNWYSSTYPYNAPYVSDDAALSGKSKHFASSRQPDYSQRYQSKDFSWPESEGKKFSNGTTLPLIQAVETVNDRSYYPVVSDSELYRNTTSSNKFSVSVGNSSLAEEAVPSCTADNSASFASESTSIYSSSRDSLKLSWSSTKTSSVISSSNAQAAVDSSELSTDRGRHSSHSSNSSVSSLSQSFLTNSADAASSTWFPPKDTGEGTSSCGSVTNRSRSSSRNATPSVSNSGATPTSSSPTSSASSTSFETSGSLTSLVFSKPSTWTTPTSSATSSQLTSSGSTLRPSTSPLTSGIQPQGIGGSLFSPATDPSLLSGGSHQVMFAPSLAPPGSFLQPSAAVGTPVYPADPLFAAPNQDLLRRELDTRFLASHDRSINIPPPPYMRTEMHQHQHQHTHMHQHTPYLPPPLGAPLLPQGAAHLYDKFPKIDTSFYGRGSFGLHGYPTLSPFLAPSAAAAATPFGPPGHLAAFQPKANTLIKTKQLKSGRWCAMHVRIAWEIYHHQQKQQHSESHKNAGGPVGQLPGTAKSPSELLHPSTAMFPSLPKPHDLSFSSSLFGAASRLSSIHPRSPYEIASPHGSFLAPSAAHLGMSPLARPAYPAFGAPGSSFGGLGSLGLGGAGLFGSKELGAGVLTQDPWTRLHRTPPSAFPSPSASNSSGSSSWGGLKAEAERERERLQQRDDQEKERQKKLPTEKEKPAAEKTKEVSRDKREEKQKERDRETRTAYHQANNVDVLGNGEFNDRSRERHWDRPREKREQSRSPVRVASGPKIDSSAFDSKPKSENVKVKEEKKDGGGVGEHGADAADRTKVSEGGDRPRHAVPTTERSPLPPQFWSPLPPSPVLPIGGSSSLAMSEHYRNLELQQLREMDREQLLHKYGHLPAGLPMVPDRIREAELARHSAYDASSVERLERERQLYERKLVPPPPLRADMTFVPPLGLPPPPTTAATSHSNGSGLFPFSNSFLSGFCGGSPAPAKNPVPPAGNGIPPPLVPCGSPSSANSPLHLKPTGAVQSDSPQDSYPAKEKRDLAGQPREAETQSR